MSKRCFDVVVAALALLALALPMAGIALLVRWRLGGPVLFRQMRPGKGGAVFELVKFRTMRVATHDANGVMLTDAERLTKLGRILRNTSLDELPELWNVLRGDMSLVGPRPLLSEYLPLYSQKHARRHEVRPGITGLAQVNGRNDTTWDQRLDLDVEYVDNASFWLDLKILGRTHYNVVARKGISHSGHATMPKYRGIRP